MITFFVKFPDVSKAESYDREYEESGLHNKLDFEENYIDLFFEVVSCAQTAIKMRQWLIKFTLVHALCVIVNIYREIYETKLGLIGRVMRGVEVIGLGSYNLGIIMGLGNISVFYYWENMKKEHPNQS